LFLEKSGGITRIFKAELVGDLFNGVITVPTIMLRLLQGNQANIPVFDKLFIANLALSANGNVLFGNR
jgi:hypothetical protein